MAHPDRAHGHSTDGQEDDQFDELLRQRARRRLAHIFTLLALSLPRDLMRVAFRGLESTDQHLTGTALEYLDSVLPSEIRAALWPFLTNEPDQRLPPRPREEIVGDLMSCSLSMEVQLEADGDLESWMRVRKERVSLREQRELKSGAVIGF